MLTAQREITIEDFTRSNVFAQRSVPAFNWMNDGKSFSVLEGNQIVRYGIPDTKPLEVILNANVLKPQVRIENFFFSSDEKKILLQTNTQKIYRRSFKAEYYVYDRSNKSLKKLSEGGPQSYATFSPDAGKIAFARDNNLFIVNLEDMQEKRITDDGKMNQIINGTTDWVYEEEFTFVKAFYWSPDSKKLAYYRFDESGVKQYTLQKWHADSLYPVNHIYKYPKAGEDNSVLSIHIYDLTTNSTTRAEYGSDDDIYIPRVKWTSSSAVLSVRKMNRLQNTLEIFHVDAASGKSKTVITEKSDTYIDIDFTDHLYYLADGKNFIHATEKSGYNHLYLYNMDGKPVNQITSGEWEVTDVYGIDEKTRTIYYSSTEPGYLQRHLYSIAFDGSKKKRLTAKEGVHTISFSDDYQFYIDKFSSASQPLTVSLYNTRDNKLLTVLENNASLKKSMETYGLVPKEFFKYKSADGTTMLDGYMLKPKNMTADKKYPVLVYQYSGPRAPSVANDFGAGAYYFWFQMLVQKGYIVAVMDTRGTSYRGEKFVKQTYRQLGKLELEDLLAGATFLKSLEYVDGDRLGIFGWSYGGYMTSLVMTKGAGVYRLGIAGAPVTTWRFYDNIYTERYLQRPQDNPAGYDDNSPITYAGQLQGKFMLIHGTGDDNVHVQNTIVFQNALIKAGKQFEQFFYPNEDHSIPRSGRSEHFYTMMTDFILKNL